MAQLMDIDERFAYYKEQLRSKEEMLAQTTRFLVNTQRLVEERNKALEEINKDIFDSITLASVIQTSLLPHPDILKVFFRDASYRVIQQIGIGGDTVFVKNTSEGVMFGLLDATGHGVPAALLSISSTVVLKELISSMQLTCPRPLLRLLNQQMHATFNGTDRHKPGQMEGVIFHYSTSENRLTYSSAKGKALHLKSNGEVVNLASDRCSVGEDPDLYFSLFELQAEAGDKLLIYSDGLQDQFGGQDNKKFTAQRLKRLLAESRFLPATDLAERIETEFRTWKGSATQTDDVSFILIDL